MSTDFNQLQHDVLIRGLTLNPLMTSHALPQMNKALNTNRKEVVRAINELLASMNTLSGTTSGSINQLTGVVGDYTGNPEALADLRKIEESILLAVLKIYTDMAGDLDSPEDITDIHQNVKGAIRKINDTVSKVNEVKAYYSYDDKKGSPNGETVFHLTYVPIKGSISLRINGVVYDGSEFSYDEEENAVTWLFTEENGGFDLERDEFDLSIVYDFLYAENDVDDPKKVIGNNA